MGKGLDTDQRVDRPSHAPRDGIRARMAESESAGSGPGPNKNSQR
jgi:hypothetical protein